MKNMTKAGVVLVFILLLNACSIFQDPADKRRDEFRANLEAPPELILPESSNEFDIPKRSTVARASQVEPTTPRTTTALTPSSTEKQGAVETVSVSGDLSNGQLNREGELVWLELPATVQQIWPELEDFWTTSEINLIDNDQSINRMETEWVASEAGLPLGGIKSLLSNAFGTKYDGQFRDRFIVRVEPFASGSRVFFSHQGARKVYTEDDSDDGTKRFSNWQVLPPNSVLQGEMLTRFQKFLASR